MNVFELFASLSLDSSDFDRGLKSASQQSETFGGKIKSGMATLGKLGAAAAVAGGTIAVAFGKSSVDTGMQFDKAMSQVAATMGLTTDQLNSTKVSTDNFSGTLRDFAKYLGSTTVFSANQSAEALNYMALAGYSAEEAVKALPNVLNLAAAGNMDLAAASDMVTDAQSALGLTMDESTEMVDQMAKAASTSNTSVSQLGEAFLTIGGTAKDLSGGTVELSTALGLLADNGVKGAEGGTALRNILLALTPKSKEAADAMQQIGLNAYDANGNMRPLKDIFLDLNKGMEGMTTEEKQNVLATIFNKVDLKSVNALLGTNVDRWDELTTAIENSQGAAEQMAETKLDNLSGDITLAKSAFEGLQIAVSEKVTPTIRELVQGASELFTNLTEQVKEIDIDKLVDKFNELKPILEGVAIAVGSLTAAYEIYQGVQLAWEVATRMKIAMIMGETTSLWSLAAAQIAANAPMLIAVGVIGAVIAAIVLLVTHWDDVVSRFPALGEAVENLKTMVMEFIQTLGEAFKAFYEGVLKPLIEWVVNDVIPAILPVINTIIDTVVNLAVRIANIVSGIIQVIKGIIDFLVGIFTGDWEKAWNGIKEIFSGFGSVLQNLVQGVFEAVRGLFTAGMQVISGIWTSAWTGMKTAVSTIFEGIKNVIKSVINGIIGAINGMIRGIVSGINAVGTVLNKLKIDIPDWVPSLGGKSFGLNIPKVNAPQIPLLAKGGVIGSAGSAVVGEDGAELVHLPRGAQVTPLNRNNSDFMELTEEMSETQQNTNELIRLIIEILRGGVPIDVDERDFRRKVRSVMA